jgi:hypothetical protein
MALYEVTGNSKIWRSLTGETPSGDIGSIAAGDTVEGGTLGNGYASISKKNGASLNGFVRSSVLRLSSVTPPPPPPPAASDEYILHVKDGVTRKFIPE